MLKSVYLDWNVYTYLLNGDYPQLEQTIEHAKNRNVILPFTSTHIEEATNIKDNTERINRLRFISEFSNNIYFENSITDFGLIRRSPFDVYETINTLPSTSRLMRRLANMISRPMLKAARKSLGLDPEVLNNKEPHKVWNEIDRAILESKFSKTLPEEFRESPIKGMVDYIKQDSLERFGPIHEQMGGSKKRAIGPDIIVSILYSLLESFGYYPEKKKVFEKASRINDAAHCFYSLWSDVCVSKDKGFRMKSKAIASLVGSSVVYVDPASGDDVINSMNRSDN